MGKLYSLVSALLLTIGFANAADPLNYEYWFDNDHSSKVNGQLTDGSNSLSFDIASPPSGVHYFNFRVGSGDTSWGSVYRKKVLNLAGSVDAVAYEYWIDNNYSAKISGELSPGVNSYDIDLNGVRRGLHRFNYRLKTGEGVWGTPFTSYFYSETNSARFSAYEYWLDNDYANRVTGNATGNPTGFEVDLSSFDKSGGVHYFNLRTRDGDGDWSPIYHKLLIFNKTEKRQPIIGYRHYLNGKDLGYVEVDRQFIDSYMFEVSIPDSLMPNIRNSVPKFEEDKVSIEGNDSITYSMQIRTELGWAAPEKWDIGVSNDFSTTALHMDINSRQTFVSPSANEFAAIRFTAAGDSLYFRADAPIWLHIYKDGEKVVQISPEEIESMAMVELREGEYFGILFSTDENKSDEFTLHLMDTPNSVPEPTISFEEGVVTMTCTRDDAEIRYTLDNSEPNAESQLYTEPFELLHNATVKAKAYVPGSDIQPSLSAELIVDSYKTATPYGEFDVASKTLTLHCDTEGASIFYTFEIDSEWNAYTSPVTIDGNGTVFAKATCDGFNDSDIAEIVVSDVKCAGIVFSYNGRYLRISTDEPESAIRFTSDGSEPSSGPEYTGEFDVEGLCLVRAVVVKEGYMNSDVAELAIDRYADEEHAVTSSEGLLESCFGWSADNFCQSLERFRVEGVLNEADYKFLKNMGGLRHLDIEKVRDANIPDYAFRNSNLISISLPEDIAEYGDSILVHSPYLSSIIWNSRTHNIDGRLTDGLENPNILLYVPAEINVKDSRQLNVVSSGHASSLELHYGYPYYAALDFHADYVSLTRDFIQSTEIGVCRGWEAIVLPFEPNDITHEVNGPIVPFAGWNGDTEGIKPFWLYRSTEDGWVEAAGIETCVPYIISMPNSADYVPTANLAGRVTFSAAEVELGPGSSSPAVTAWVDNSDFKGTFMPVEEEGALSLNVNVSGEDLLPGSTFISEDVTVPFGAYVINANGRKAMPVFSDGNGVNHPTVGKEGVIVTTPAAGMICISSMRECIIPVTTATGVLIRTLHLQPGDTVSVEGLTRDLYIVGGTKVMVR